MDHVILIGFMGSGKTSVGKRVSYAAGLPFVDTDELIVAKTGMQIKDIFAQHGESWFREVETEVLKELAKDTKRKIVSVGGGVPVQSQNQPILKAMGQVVLLEASTDTLEERLQYDTSRPILQGGNLREKIESIKAERAQAYQSSCDAVVVTDGKNLRQVVSEVMRICSLSGAMKK